MSKVPDFTDERSSSDVSEGRKEQEFDRHRNQGNILFIGNLPFHAPWQHIKDQFRQAGKVRYTDLIADRSGRPKGSALVTMQTSDGARRAIRLFNESEFEGRRLIVRLFDDGPRPQLVQRDQMPAYNRRRENLPPTAATTQQHQGQNNHHANINNAGGNAHFNRANNGAHVNNGAPRNIANSAPISAPKNNHGGPANQKAQRTISTDDVDVPKPRSLQANEADRKLFVSNLPFDCSAAALRETFQQIGGVDRAEIIVGRSGKSRGMGIVVMSSAEEARVAIAEFDGIEMAGRAMNVRFDQKI
jgi:RNA recognition motif-containing protein